MLMKYNSFVYVEYPKIFGCSMKWNWVNAWMYKELYFRLFHFSMQSSKRKMKGKVYKDRNESHQYFMQRNVIQNSSWQNGYNRKAEK